MNNQFGTATYKQRWALFCITKEDYRTVFLDKEKASQLIQELGGNKPAKKDYKKIIAEIHKECFEYGNQHQPTPMLVAQHESPLNDSSPIKQTWAVPDGVCGFAWVSFKGTEPFAKWCKENTEWLRSIGLYFGNSYPTGKHLSVMHYNQSYEKKMKYAGHLAHLLVEKSIVKSSYPEGRLD